VAGAPHRGGPWAASASRVWGAAVRCTAARAVLRHQAALIRVGMSFARAGRGAAESWWCPSAVRAPAGMAQLHLDAGHVPPLSFERAALARLAARARWRWRPPLLTRMDSLPQRGSPPSPRSRHGVAVEARLSRSGGHADAAPTSCEGKRPGQAHHADMDHVPPRSSWKPQESAQQDHPWPLRGWAGHQLRQQGAFDGLLTCHAARPSGANFADVTALWFLDRLLRQRKPRTLVAFGSGCSTVMLAQALWENRHQAPDSGGGLYSIDADPSWAAATAKAMPPHLPPLCRILSSPLLEVAQAGTLGFRPATIPDVAANFLYEEGPALTPARRMAIDVVAMEDKLPHALYMGVDDRQENTASFKRNWRQQ
jgi:hypothetical protein